MVNFKMEESIALYFRLGLSQREIMHAMAQIDGIVISKRTLQRRLRQLKLYRRKHWTDLLDVSTFVLNELENSGQMLGYRLMHTKCLSAGFVVTMDTVRQLLGILDPNGVILRSRRRLLRRVYHSNGPNYIWHMDSYDKLKPYGLCINGAIDGFSRKIIWLQAYFTSNNPAVISGYYIDAIKTLNACPLKIRADLGTENGFVEHMQQFLRSNENGMIPLAHAFLYGSSNHNQRIEAWWCFLRKSCSQYWMNLLQDLKDEGMFSGHYLDKNLIQFCFMNLLQSELDEVAKTWNCHKIRCYKNQTSPSGRPILMYACPELFGKIDCYRPVDAEKLLVCEEECVRKGASPCEDLDIYELCCIIMTENGLDIPENTLQAKELYMYLRNYISNDCNLIA